MMSEREIRVKTRVKSITLETDETGLEVERCLLVLADKDQSQMAGAHLIVNFTASGRGSLHVGQHLELSITLPEPEPPPALRRSPL
jgi:hypothetical protein